MTGYPFREAVAAFRRAPLLTSLSSMMVGVALFVVGLFALASYNLRLALTAIEERVEVVAYLRDDASPDDIDRARQELAKLPEVLSVRFVSKKAALERARKDLPEFSELFSDVEVNPLPQSLEIELQPDARNKQAVGRVADAARGYSSVEDVRYGQEWVDKLFALRRIGAVTAAVMGGAFALVAALIIGTALRIAIFARREEIHVMRLVGATNGFIRRPFLIEGAMAGLLGGVIAWGLTYTTYRGLYAYIFAVAWIPQSWVLAGVLAGGIFGAISSALAVRRYLREV